MLLQLSLWLHVLLLHVLCQFYYTTTTAAATVIILTPSYAKQIFIRYPMKQTTFLDITKTSQLNLAITRHLCMLRNCFKKAPYSLIKGMFPWSHSQVLSFIVNLKLIETRKQGRKNNITVFVFHLWRWNVANMGHPRIAYATHLNGIQI